MCSLICPSTIWEGELNLEVGGAWEGWGLKGGGA